MKNFKHHFFRCLITVYILFSISSTLLSQGVDTLKLSTEKQKIKEYTLGEIYVTSDRYFSKPLYRISEKNIKTIISAMGEADPIKYIQTLPGVATGIEGTSAIYVRGGNIGNNLMTLDGVTVYGSSHLFGFTSIFAPGIIDKTDFYVGGFTSEDGNLLSSHIKLTSKDGDFKACSTTFNVSNFLVSGTLSAPIVRDKVSILVSARISPVTWEYNALKGFLTKYFNLPDKLTASVYDVFAKLKYDINAQNSLAISFFNSHDKYDYYVADKSDDMMTWDNIIAGGVWNYFPNNKWNVKTTISYNSFSSEQYQEKRISTTVTEPTAIQISSSIKEITFSSLAKYNFDKNVKIQFGAEVKSSEFNPGSYKSISKISDYQNNKYENNKSNNLLANINAQLEYEEQNKLSIRLSGRLNYFNGENYNRVNPEIRFFGNYFITQHMGINSTVDLLTQFYHTLEGLPTGWSVDMIIPPDEQSPPEKASQFYLGTFANIGKMTKLSLGGFYKTMKNLVYYPDAANFFGSTTVGWKDGINIGTGESYGLEFLAEKSGERFSARVAYTLSKTDRKFPGENNGKSIPFKFDRRHILNVTSSYILKKSKKAEYGVTTAFVLTSGHYESLKAGSYYGFMPGFDNGNSDDDKYIGERDYFTHRNNYLMPKYIRWDVGFYLNITGAKVNHTLNIGIYNVLNRHNAYSLYWDSDNKTWKQLSILPIMPTMSYSISF